eukprot:7417567-Pyramimonas_sp.AAC.1
MAPRPGQEAEHRRKPPVVILSHREEVRVPRTSLPHLLPAWHPRLGSSTTCCALPVLQPSPFRRSPLL